MALELDRQGDEASSELEEQLLKVQKELNDLRAEHDTLRKEFVAAEIARDEQEQLASRLGEEKSAL